MTLDPDTEIRGRAWLDLENAITARERQGMTPEIDATRNPDRVAATLASFAGEIQAAGRNADAGRYRALLVETAAECMAADAAARAADREERAGNTEKRFGGRLQIRKAEIRRDILASRLTRPFAAPAHSPDPTPGTIPAQHANAVREDEKTVTA